MNSEGIKHIGNRLSMLEIVRIDPKHEFLAHLEAEIWPGAHLGGPGGTGPPKRGLGGSKNLRPANFVLFTPKPTQNNKKIALYIKIEMGYILVHMEAHYNAENGRLFCKFPV